MEDSVVNMSRTLEEAMRKVRMELKELGGVRCDVGLHNMGY
jgi:hypothetical protein